MARQAGGASSYSFATSGQSLRNEIPGLRIFKSGKVFQTMKPSWNHTHSVFRFFPAIDHATGQFLPMRDTNVASDRNYTDWIRRYDGVTIGTAGVTFFIENPGDATFVAQQGPAWAIYYAAQNLKKSGQARPEWMPYISKDANPKKNVPIDKPKSWFLVRGAALMHKSRPCNPPVGLDFRQRPLVICMTDSAGEGLVYSANQNTQLDIVNMDAGVYVDYYQDGTPPIFTQPGQNAMPFGGLQSGQPQLKYSVQLMEQFNGASASLTQFRDGVAQWLMQEDWDDFLDFPTVEAQVGMICRSGLPADLVMYCLGDMFGEYIPADVKDAARNRGMVSVGMQVPTQQYQMPAPFQPQPGYPAAGFQQPGYPAGGYPQMDGQVHPQFAGQFPGQPAMGQPATGLPGQMPGQVTDPAFASQAAQQPQFPGASPPGFPQAPAGAPQGFGGNPAFGAPQTAGYMSPAFNAPPGAQAAMGVPQQTSQFAQGMPGSAPQQPLQQPPQPAPTAPAGFGAPGMGFPQQPMPQQQPMPAGFGAPGAGFPQQPQMQQPQMQMQQPQMQQPQMQQGAMPPQPTDMADPNRRDATMAALELARNRARQ